MNRHFWVVALVLAVGPGCVTLPTWFQPQGTKPEVEVPPPPPKPVTRDEITETNYGNKINALREELDYQETWGPGRVTVHTVDGVK